MGLGHRLYPVSLAFGSSTCKRPTRGRLSTNISVMNLSTITMHANTHRLELLQQVEYNPREQRSERNVGDDSLVSLDVSIKNRSSCKCCEEWHDDSCSHRHDSSREIERSLPVVCSRTPLYASLKSHLSGCEQRMSPEPQGRYHDLLENDIHHNWKEREYKVTRP